MGLKTHTKYTDEEVRTLLSAYRVTDTVTLGEFELWACFDKKVVAQDLTVVIRFPVKGAVGKGMGFINVPDLPLTEETDWDPTLKSLLFHMTEEEAETLLRKLVSRLKEMSSTPIGDVPNFFKRM